MSANQSEQLRQRRIDANKRRMAEIGVAQTAAAMRPAVRQRRSVCKSVGVFSKYVGVFSKYVYVCFLFTTVKVCVLSFCFADRLFGCVQA